MVLFSVFVVCEKKNKKKETKKKVFEFSCFGSRLYHLLVQETLDFLCCLLDVQFCCKVDKRFKKKNSDKVCLHILLIH